MSLFSIIASVLTLGRASTLPHEKEQDDFEFRAERGELTREEARRYLQERIDHNQRENDRGAWWHDW